MGRPAARDTSLKRTTTRSLMSPRAPLRDVDTNTKLDTGDGRSPRGASRVGRKKDGSSVLDTSVAMKMTPAQKEVRGESCDQEKVPTKKRTLQEENLRNPEKLERRGINRQSHNRGTRALIQHRARGERRHRASLWSQLCRLLKMRAAIRNQLQS